MNTLPAFATPTHTLRRTAPLLILLLTVAICSLVAQTTPSTKLPKLTTVNGTTYTDITVTSVEAAGIRITHDSGLTTIPWAQVPADLRTALGYDPQKMAEAAKQAQVAANAREPKARIGATPEDFRKAGCAFIGTTQSNIGSTETTFLRGDYYIFATFWRGTCHQLAVTYADLMDARPDFARSLSNVKKLTGAYETFIKALLEANAGGSAWEQLQWPGEVRNWKRKDGRVIASYIPGRIKFTTKEFNDAIQADTEARRQKSLNGF